MDPDVKRILRKAVPALEAAKVSYAVGGGVALEAYGYRRSMEDVDIFLSPDQSAPALEAIALAGFAIEPVLAPNRYAAFETKRGRVADPSIRLNLTFPLDDPEHAAILAPESHRVGGTVAKVFPLVLLVAAKWYANRPEDDLDFEALLGRGLLPMPAVQAYLCSIDDQDGAAQFERRMRELSTPRRARPRPTRS